MKFSCNQKPLIKALNTVNKAVNPKTTVPILKNILFKAEDNKLVLTASDMDITIRHVIKEGINVEEEGETVLPAQKLTEIVRKLPECDITLENTEENIISIRTTNFLADLFCISADEFPQTVNDDPFTDTHIFNSGVFADMIRKTSFAASYDESTGIITGVLIEIEEDSLNMIALDRFRMAVSREPARNIKNESIVIGAKILNEIMRILTDDEEDEDVIFKISQKRAQLIYGLTEISVRILEGEYIKYRELMAAPKEGAIKVKVNRSSLISAIERASLMANEGKYNLIRMDMKRDVMSIASRSEEGSIREDVDIEKDGEDLAIGFNAKYFLDALKAVDDDEIMIRFNGSLNPALIEPLEGDGYDYLIMAVRI